MAKARVYCEAKLISSELAESFKDDKGQDVVYAVNFLKTKEGDMLELNSKNDYGILEGKEGVAEIVLRSVDGQKANVYKASLAGFQEGVTIDQGEEIK